MKRVLIALSALLFVNHVAADQAAVIANLADASTCTESQYRQLASDSSVSCVACSVGTFLDTSDHGYKVKLATGDGLHPACCSESGDVVCRAMMTAYKKGCQATGDSNKGATATCTA